MHCIHFWNLFKIWRVLEATYLKLHGKEKSGNKNLRTHLRTELGHFCIRHLRVSHNTPCLPPKILLNLCFSFLLGITAVPKEIDNNVYPRVGGEGGGGGLGEGTGCILGYKDKMIYLMSNTHGVVTQSPEAKAHVRSDWQLQTKNYEG